jgi:hypothetical protein
MIRCFLDSSFMVGHRDRKLTFRLFAFRWLQTWSFVHLNPSLPGFVGKHTFPVFLLSAGFCVHWKSDCMNEINLQNCSLKCMTHSRFMDYLPITTASVKMSLSAEKLIETPTEFSVRYNFSWIEAHVDSGILRLQTQVSRIESKRILVILYRREYLQSCNQEFQQSRDLV